MGIKRILILIFVIVHMIDLRCVSAQQIHKTSPLINRYLTEYYSAQEKGDSKSGLDALHHLIEEDYGFAPFHSAIASILINTKSGDPFEILTELSAAIILDSMNIQYYQNRATYLWGSIDDELFHQSVLDYKKILAMDSTLFEPYEKIYAYFLCRDTKAAALISKQARIQMHKLVNTDSLNANNWYLLGEAFEMFFDEPDIDFNNETSLLCYNRAISIDSTQFRYYWNRGLTYFWFKKDYDACIRDMQKCLNLNSDYLYYEYLAQCYEKKGDRKRALEILNEGLSVYPDQRNLVKQQRRFSE